MALAALLEEVEANIAAFDGVSSSVESDELRAAVVLRERADALMLLMAGAWDRTERWRADGHLTAAAALRADGMPSFDATRTIRSARLVARNERLAKTLATGDLTADHVATMARHVGRERLDRFDEHADALIDGASTLNPDDTTAMMRRWASHVDDLDNRGEPADIENMRGVWAHRVGDAMEGRFLGHPDDIAALLTALDRMQPPDPKSTPGGARTLAQRRYDALIDLADLGLQGRNGRIDPTHTVHVSIDATTLTGGFDPHGRSDMPGFGSVLPTRVQQLLCGSWISRVIMDPDGQPLDLGRARFFSPAQHQAIVERDGGCAINGCDRRCDAHHLDPYGTPTQGETNLDNGLGMCRPHHTLVHNGWTPLRNPDGTWYLEPP